MLGTFSLGGGAALITGGNRGLGLAFARALAQARVAIAARDADRNRQAVELLRGEELAVSGIS